jgi:hypothetical protein
MSAIPLPRYIFTALAVIFLIAAVNRMVREGHLGTAARTWLTIAIIFGAVSAWLWLSGPNP